MQKAFKLKICQIIFKKVLTINKKQKTSILNNYNSVYNIMKVVNSLKSLKNRNKNCKMVSRRGVIYIINKENPKFKARQGKKKHKRG